MTNASSSDGSSGAGRPSNQRKASAFSCLYAPTRGLEPVIHAKAEDVRKRKSVVDAGQHVAAILEAHVEILRLRRPVGREADLDAAAKRPAQVRLRFAHPCELDLAAAVGEAAGKIGRMLFMA